MGWGFRDYVTDSKTALFGGFCKAVLFSFGTGREFASLSVNSRVTRPKHRVALFRFDSGVLVPDLDFCFQTRVRTPLAAFAQLNPKLGSRYSVSTPFEQELPAHQGERLFSVRTLLTIRPTCHLRVELATSPKRNPCAIQFWPSKEAPLLRGCGAEARCDFDPSTTAPLYVYVFRVQPQYS